jgi:hypothetical protein
MQLCVSFRNPVWPNNPLEHSYPEARALRSRHELAASAAGFEISFKLVGSAQLRPEAEHL